jgi:beta-lactamase class A
VETELAKNAKMSNRQGKEIGFLMEPTRRQCLIALGGGIAEAAGRSLAEEWRRIARETDGTVGAAAVDLTSFETNRSGLVSLNGEQRFPLASVCKVPIAMNILAMVDEGKLDLRQEIEVLPRDVWAGVSDVEKRWPGQRRFVLNELIELMVARSDNTAVETLFRIGGEGPAMAARFREWKVEGVSVDRSERQCYLDRNGVENYPPPAEWTNEIIDALIAKTTPVMRYRAIQRYLEDPRDTGTPNGTVQLLARAFRGEALSKSSTARLIEIMKATTTFPTRLRGLLPAGTVVAHKTGSTGTERGLAGATNDCGVIFLPKGGQLAVAVYVKASTRNDAARDRVIADIARAAFDSYR